MLLSYRLHRVIVPISYRDQVHKFSENIWMIAEGLRITSTHYRAKAAQFRSQSHLPIEVHSV